MSKTPLDLHPLFDSVADYVVVDEDIHAEKTIDAVVVVDIVVDIVVVAADVAVVVAAAAAR